MAKKEMERSTFHKYKSIKMIVVGILILLNAIYGLFTWGVFVGGVVALLGLAGLIIPHPRCK